MKGIQENAAATRDCDRALTGPSISLDQPCNARHYGRMAVVKRGVDGVGMQIGKVVTGELDQCGGEGVRSPAHLRCKTVGFPLVPAG